MHGNRRIFIVLGLLSSLAGCPGQTRVDVARGGSAAAEIGGCGAPWVQAAPDGRAVVAVRCRFPALVLAGYRAGGLVDLARSGRAVTDDELRRSAEFESLTDADNVWQWRDGVTDAEALAMCRLMLADLRAGGVIDWEREARGYLVRVRGADILVSGDHGSPAARASEAAAALVGAPSVRGPEDRIPARVVFEDKRTVLDRIEQEPGSGGALRDLAERLAMALAVAEAEAGALAVVFAGVAAVVIAVDMGGKTVVYEFSVGAGVALDRELATKLGQPLLEDLGRQLHELEVLSQEAQERIGGPGGRLSRLTADERIVYRELVNRPVAELSPGELERIQRLREHGSPIEVFEPGSAVHKAQRWADYQARDGSWPFERWSPNYDQNIERASRAHAVADRRWRELGWGRREVRVQVDRRVNEWRILDIGDEEEKQGVEVKSGYVTFNANVATQVVRDAKLVQEDWTITWYVEGRCSDPLRKALRNAGIELQELYPEMPIKRLRQLLRSLPAESTP